MGTTAASTTPTAPGRAPASAIAALGRRVDGSGPPAGAPIDPALRERAAAFLVAEARLLDARRYDEWLDGWHPDGLFWVPLDPGRRAEVVERQSLVLDDRARLGERVERLRSRAAWSQVPSTRTVRHVGNVEAWVDGADGAVEARSVLTLHAHRAGVTGVLAARQEHRLVPAGGGLRIVVKVLALVDAEAAHDNLSFLL